MKRICQILILPVFVVLCFVGTSSQRSSETIKQKETIKSMVTMV